MTEKQVAYHGTPYDFEEFKLSKMGTGQELQHFGYGLYFTADPQVAISYKNETSIKANEPATNYSFPSNEYKDPINSKDALGRAAELIYRYDYETAIAISEDKEDEDYYPELANDLSEFDEDDEIIENIGIIYEVKIPSSDRLIDLDGSYSDTLSNLSILEKLIGEEKISEIEEYCLAFLNPSIKINDFNEMFNRIIIEDHSPSLEDDIERMFPGIDTAVIINMLDGHHMEYSDEYTGKNLMHFLDTVLGDPQKSAEFLKELRVPGAKTKSSMYSNDSSEVFIVWDEAEIKVKDRHFNDSELEILADDYSQEDLEHYNY